MDRKTDIIIEANKLFFQKDFEKVSLNEIALNLGITKGGIYHYFDSKQTLLEEVMRFNFKMIEEVAFKSISESTNTKEAIFNFFNVGEMAQEIEDYASEQTGISSISNEAEKYYYFIFNIAIKNEGSKKEIKQLYQKSIDLIATILKKGQLEGDVKESLDADIVALQFVALLEGLMLFEVFNVGDLKEKAKLIITQLWEQIKK